MSERGELEQPSRLELRGVTAGYGEVTVLRDVSLTVPTGQLVALLGPNGAGKTTLLRTVAGLTSVRSGRIRYGDRDVTRLSSGSIARAGICFITEQRAVFPTLSVQENLALFAGGRAAAGNAAEPVFELFPRLKERRRQKAGTLSGGEQQMLALSRAVLSGGRTLLVDELSMGLAPRLVDELFDVLSAWRSNAGINTLLVEQYAPRALALADLVFVLNKGRVVFAGEPSELSQSPLLRLYLGDVA